MCRDGPPPYGYRTWPMDRYQYVGRNIFVIGLSEKIWIQVGSYYFMLKIVNLCLKPWIYVEIRIFVGNIIILSWKYTRSNFVLNISVPVHPKNMFSFDFKFLNLCWKPVWINVVKLLGAMVLCDFVIRSKYTTRKHDIWFVISFNFKWIGSVVFENEYF